jgi:hypothetical protein
MPTLGSISFGKHGEILRQITEEHRPRCVICGWLGEWNPVAPFTPLIGGGDVVAVNALGRHLHDAHPDRTVFG